MKTKLVTVFCLFLYFCTHSQTINLSDILKSVQKAQSNLKTASYLIKRVDTLVTGDIRFMSGKVFIEKDKSDTLLGFKFWSKKDGDSSERIYDGHIGYEIHTDNKTYHLFNTPTELERLLINGGAQLVIPELVKLDTSRVGEMKISQNSKYYYLNFFYPDLKEYDVIKREKIISIDKQTMLPIAVRSHQETLGKVQDLYFRIYNITINQPINYDFALLPFLKDYVQVVPVAKNDFRKGLRGKAAPDFNLPTFDGKYISTADFKGKVILLDFWEVWCGPCQESMPKIQELYNKYKGRGFEVYGVTNDLKQLQSAKAFVKKKEVNFQILIGNEQLKKDYKLEGVPQYVLIDKMGKINFISLGYSPDMEKIIADSLNQ